MIDAVYLAWQYLRFHRRKTTALVTAVVVIVALPLSLNVLIDRAAGQLTRRAEATPLLVGAEGSPLQLVLRSLYFRSDNVDTIPYAEFLQLKSVDFEYLIPLHAGRRTRFAPIVGTTRDYFVFRDLNLAEGHMPSILGECVIGSDVARQENLHCGDSILSSDQEIFDLSAAVPLKMKIVGILARSHSPDDGAVFVDLETAWIIDGLGHGHEDVARGTGDDTTEGAKHTEQAASHATVAPYHEITVNNVRSFHFHGDRETFPTSAVIVVPANQKAAALIEGRYLDQKRAQIVRPNEVMAALVDTVFTVGRYVTVAAVVLGSATLAMMSLVFALSVEMRRQELATMAKMGGSAVRIASVLALEVMAVLGLGTLLAVTLALLASRFADAATQLVVDVL